MLPHLAGPSQQNPSSPPDPPPPEPPATCIGVGIDTSRYAHYAVSLRADLQAAAPDLKVVEAAAGYARLRERLAGLAARHGRVLFRVRVDAAGLDADNLLAWFAALNIENARFSVSVGDTQRNKNQRVAIYGQQISDPPETRVCARYAITERPGPLRFCQPNSGSCASSPAGFRPSSARSPGSSTISIN
jgi:hypothetical protein